MKKSIFALVLALVLCLSTCALAETAVFPFSVEEFVECYKAENEGVVVTEEQGAVVLECAEGAPVRVTYDMDGMCTGQYGQVKVSLSDSSEASSAGEKLGFSASAMMYATRLIELNYDDAAVFEEISAMMDGFVSLFTSFTDEDYENCITAPVSHEQEICGHTAVVTFSFDLLEMALVMDYAYLP